jgi:DNA helicase-2/ATP-dependent DNA helicase PcrA
MLHASGLVDFYKTEKEGQDRIENLAELVNAAEAFVTQEGFGKDAVALPVDETGGPGGWRWACRRRAGAGRDARRRDRRNHVSPLAAFLTHAALEAGDNQAQAGQDAIQLMTVHSAKGLEFDAVFITGSKRPVPARERAVRHRRPGRRAPADVRGHHARAQAAVPELQPDPHAARPDPLQRQEPLLRRTARGRAEVADAAQPGLRLGLCAEYQQAWQRGTGLGSSSAPGGGAAGQPAYTAPPLPRPCRRPAPATACGWARRCSTPSSAKAWC